MWNDSACQWLSLDRASPGVHSGPLIGQRTIILNENVDDACKLLWSDPLLSEPNGASEGGLTGICHEVPPKGAPPGWGGGFFLCKTENLNEEPKNERRAKAASHGGASDRAYDYELLLLRVYLCDPAQRGERRNHP